MLYHRSVFWHRSIPAQLPTERIKIIYSAHAKQAARDDRYGQIVLPLYVNCENIAWFECELNNNGKLIKCCGQITLDNALLTIVIQPDNLEKGSWFARTVWLNQLHDSHRTLNRGRYARQ